MDIGALLLVFFIVVSLQPLVQQRALEMMRRRKISAIEQERGSRVILMAHRQETMRLLGFPIVQYINMNDTEEVIHAIRMTDPDMPLDIILHTPGGIALAAIQIARAVKEHRGHTTVFVPHYAMSGGTLIALAADEIVLGPHAVLGPIDPQIDGYPAGAIIEAAERKPVNEIDDSTLILESISRRAIAQLHSAVLSLLSDEIEAECRENLAKLLTTGLWTHDYGITAAEATGMGLPVNTGLPAAIYDLMRLFPQPLRRTPNVEYLPFRHEPAPPQTRA
jgi:ClpP class serine protease